MIKEGTVLGKRYEILERIGSGGMGDVYKGKDHTLNRNVAIKVLKSDYRADEVFVQNFVTEAQAAAGLSHPNVVSIYDVGQDRGLYYIVMELVEGITLKDYIEKKGKLSARETISISIQMLSGIQAAHEQHIIHRDIKPQNIIISNDGKVKVTDFGIARATTSTSTTNANVMGSVHYISPEQARGGIVDEKSDLYSAGITMYEMVTGHVPFDGDSTVSVAVMHLQDEIVPPSEEVPDIPYSLECIILKCTQKDTSKRYQDCQELIADLKHSLVDPDGDFVKLDQTPVGSETVVMSEEELEELQSQYDDDDDEYDDEEDERDRRRRDAAAEKKRKRNIRILVIVAVILVALMALFAVGYANGWFGNGSKISSDSEAKVAVPDVVGMTEEEAQAALHEKGLGMEVISRKASDKYDEGVVMEQNPKANKKVAKNSQVEVVISTGEEVKTVKVPDVVGKDESAAQKTLEKSNLVVESEAQYDDNVASGKVISTSPPAGTEVDEGTKVTMYVSMGAEKVTVPNLVGSTSADAQARLNNAGLSVGTITESYSNDYAAGTVMSQGTSAGSKVSKGTAVNFVVSKGQQVQTVTVPNVVGQTVDSAMTQLSNAGLTGVVASYQSDTSQPEGYVISQTVTGTVNKGTQVGLVVSTGSGS